MDRSNDSANRPFNLQQVIADMEKADAQSGNTPEPDDDCTFSDAILRLLQKGITEACSDVTSDDNSGSLREALRKFTEARKEKTEPRSSARVLVDFIETFGSDVDEIALNVAQKVGYREALSFLFSRMSVAKKTDNLVTIFTRLGKEPRFLQMLLSMTEALISDQLGIAVNMPNDGERLDFYLVRFNQTEHPEQIATLAFFPDAKDRDKFAMDDLVGFSLTGFIVNSLLLTRLAQNHGAELPTVIQQAYDEQEQNNTAEALVKKAWAKFLEKLRADRVGDQEASPGGKDSD